VVCSLTGSGHTQLSLVDPCDPRFVSLESRHGNKRSQKAITCRPPLPKPPLSHCIDTSDIYPHRRWPASLLAAFCHTHPLASPQTVSSACQMPDQKHTTVGIRTCKNFATNPVEEGLWQVKPGFAGLFRSRGAGFAGHRGGVVGLVVGLVVENID